MTTDIASIILVGDELLSGRVRDVNGPFLARILRAWGWRPTEMRIVGDDRSAIADAVNQAVSHAPLVVVCGGLGPTQDDRTRDAIAAVVCGGSLRRNEEAREWVAAHFRRSGRVPTSQQERQADVPDGAIVIRNPLGVAPAFLCPIEALIVVLPGVPAELRSFFGDGLPLEKHLRRDAHADSPIRFFVAGMGETACEAVLLSVQEAATWKTSFYPQQGEVEILLHPSRPMSLEQRGATLDAVRIAFGENLYEPGDGEHLEHVVVHALSHRGETVATAESLTGGLIAEMLTRVPGASAVFPLGMVTYAAAQKCARLGVRAKVVAKHGVVSEAVVREMAQGVRTRSGAVYGVATTGVAGPDSVATPDGEEIEPGTAWIAVAAKKGVTTHLFRTTAASGGDAGAARTIVRRRVAVAALNALRLVLRSR